MQRAIGMVEFNSIARGIYAADQMVKISEVEIVTAASTCPGKYIAIVHGDVAAVEDSVRIGERMAEEFFVDSIVIPNVDPGVFPAITGATMPDRVQAIGIMESFSLATMIICADQILKAVHNRKNGRNSTGNGFPKARINLILTGCCRISLRLSAETT